MKKLLITLLILAFTTSGWAALFPVKYNTATVDVDKVTGNYDSFTFTWTGFNTQSNSFWFTSSVQQAWLDLDAYSMSFKVAQKTDAGQVDYIIVTNANITKTGSNAVFSIVYTNVPMSGEYVAEMRAWESSSPLRVRSVAQGGINISDSIWDSDSADFEFPSFTGSLSDASDVEITSPAQGDILYRGASVWNNLAAGTSGQVLTTGGASANPSWTAKTSDTTFTNNVGVSGPYLTNTGGTNSGNNIIGLATGALDSRYYTEAESDARYLQDVVDDTTPELGGTLNGGNKNVTNVNTYSAGVDDTTEGTVDIYGGSNLGGTLRIYQGSDNDGVNEFAAIRALTGTLGIGWGNSPSQIRIQADGSIGINDATDRAEQFYVNGATRINGDLALSGAANLTATNASALGGVAAASYALDSDVVAATNGLAAITSIEELQNVSSAASPTDGDVLTWDGVSAWTNEAAGGGGGLAGTDLAYTNVMTLTSAALQGAIDALSSTYGGGRINATTGIYNFAASGINMSNNIEIVGCGPGATILDTRGQAQTDAAVDMIGSNCLLRAVTIISDRDGGTAFSQIDIFGNRCAVELCDLIESDQHSVFINSGVVGTRLNDIYSFNPDKRSLSNAGASGTAKKFYSDDADNFGLFGSGNHNTYTDCSWLSGGTVGAQYGSWANIANCNHRNNGQRGANLTAYCNMKGGIVADNTQDGVAVLGAYVSILGTVFHENGNNHDDIEGNGVNHGTVVGCTFEGVAGGAETGVHLDNCENWTVTGNTSSGHDEEFCQLDADSDNNIVRNNNTTGESNGTVENNQGTQPRITQVGLAEFSKDSGVAIDATADGMADDSYNGVTIGGLNAGEVITQWDLVYLYHADTELHQADAESTNTSQVLGMAVAAGTDGNELVILRQGVVRNDGWNWVSNGVPLYLSTTAGLPTTNAPSASKDVVRVVGHTLSDDEALIDIEGNWIVNP